MILLLSINNSNLQSEIAGTVRSSSHQDGFRLSTRRANQDVYNFGGLALAHFHANLLGMCKFPELEHLSAGRRIERRRRLTYSRSPSALYKNKYFPLPRIVFASLIIIYRCLRAAKKRRAAGDRQKNRVSPAARGKFSAIYSAQSGRRCTDVAYKMVIANSRV
jgi:hypothetical protein